MLRYTYTARLACPTLRRMHEQYQTGNVPFVPKYTAFLHELFAKHSLLKVHFYDRRLYENQNCPKYFVRISNIKFHQNQSGDCWAETSGHDLYQNQLSIGISCTRHIIIPTHLSHYALRVEKHCDRWGWMWSYSTSTISKLLSCACILIFLFPFCFSRNSNLW
jgi:hypothetical protein